MTLEKYKFLNMVLEFQNKVWKLENGPQEKEGLNNNNNMRVGVHSCFFVRP